MEYRDAIGNPGAEDSSLPSEPTALTTGDEGATPNHVPPRTDGRDPPPHATHRSRSGRSHRHHGHSSGSSGSSGGSGSGSSGSGGSRLDRQRRQTLIARIIAGLALTACVVLAMLLIRAQSELATHNMQTGTLASELNRTQSELTQTKQLVAAQEVELGVLLKQRIPGVSHVEIEKLDEINKGYVKKLMFSETGTGSAKHLTYNVVLKNTEDRPITPDVSILLFDRKGLQTGMARVTPATATVPAQNEQLQPGETRAYSALIERIRDDTPIYYLVEVK